MLNEGGRFRFEKANRIGRIIQYNGLYYTFFSIYLDTGSDQIINSDTAYHLKIQGQFTLMTGHTGSV